MPKSVTCKFDDEIISIDLALALSSEYKKKKPEFRCVECGERVRAHSGEIPAPHFEHLKRNENCRLSEA
jgi:competence CoiA-like predicted nuclease